MHTHTHTHAHAHAHTHTCTCTCAGAEGGLLDHRVAHRGLRALPAGRGARLGRGWSRQVLLLPTSYFLPPATCYLLPATCYLLPATYFLLPTMVSAGAPNAGQSLTAGLTRGMEGHML